MNQREKATARETNLRVCAYYEVVRVQVRQVRHGENFSAQTAEHIVSCPHCAAHLADPPLARVLRAALENDRDFATAAPGEVFTRRIWEHIRLSTRG